MRFNPLVPAALLLILAPAQAQIRLSIGAPHLSIGINIPILPNLVPVPGSPVYYAPRLDQNYFFYDGMYWVFKDDTWYASSWYNGPWALVGPETVPPYLLRVPVRYYRRQPTYFRGWHREEAPRWGEHWGREWEQRRQGWDKWDRHEAPPMAQVPNYQRGYSKNHYPAPERQPQIHAENYRYQPQEPVVREHYQEHVERGRGPDNREGKGNDKERGRREERPH